MRCLHTLIRTTNTFIYPQYRVLLGNKFSKLNELFCNYKYRIGGVMFSGLASSAVDRGFEPRSGHTKDYKIDICCFSAKHAALRRKSTDWLARFRIMCPSGATCLSVDCCFSEQALYKSSSIKYSACWSSTKRTSSSSH